ncbi:MAG: histone deacetylase family protein [Actinomycetales bacterium]
MSIDPIMVHDDRYAGWVFDAAHPTQGRRFVHGVEQVRAQATAAGVNLEVVVPSPPHRADLERIHTATYVAEVLDEFQCQEWQGARPDMAELAELFVGGTLTALHALLDGSTRTAVHLPGAKHHAQADRASGFCVFADFSIAATQACDAGHRVAILDIDAHHGDGTENLLRDHPNVLTYSIHQVGIFPGTGYSSDPEKWVFNRPLSAGDGDAQLAEGVEHFLEQAVAFDPTLLFIAAGADGLRDDPLTGLHYTVTGLAQACARVRQVFPNHPVLMGGAGGYLPDTGTPQAWGAMAAALASSCAGTAFKADSLG